MSRQSFLFFLFSIAITITMSCMDLRKRWNELVGKSESEAVNAIKKDGMKNLHI